MTRLALAGILACASVTQAGGLFADVTSAWSVKAVHAYGGRFLANMPETTGAGVAVFDYDGDGLQDLYFAQGQLFRNTGRGYAEVAGMTRFDAAMGVLAADLDSDGDPDLVVVGYDAARWLENQGDGTFAAHALAGAGYQSGVTALDYDRDGRLDLYVGRYVDYPRWYTERDAGVRAFEMGSLSRGMAVHAHAPAPNTLWRNELPGGFRDVTRAAGVADARGRTLGALAADLDGDGWTDLFVANDQSPCALFLNHRDGTFVDASREGWVDEVRGSMGVAAGDVNDDGRLDLAVTHWYADFPALYENLGRYRGAPVPRFIDRGELAGLADGPRERVGWGAAFLDADRDGRDDLLIVQGHTHYPAHRPGRLKGLPAELWRRTGPARFARVAPAGKHDPLGRARVGRGLAVGDLDRDGAADAVITVNNGPAEIWRGTPPAGTSWIGLELTGAGSVRDATGARVRLQAAGLREIAGGDSYLSTSARALVYGLRDARAVSARVRWPSGRSETFRGLAANGYRRLVEGTGEPDSIGRVAE